MAVETIELGGRQVLIEVVPVGTDDRIAPTPSRSGQFDRGGVPGEPTALPALADTASRIRETIEAVLRPVAVALEAVGPEEWNVELSLGFKGNAGIPFVANGEANGSVKVSAKWKKASPAAAASSSSSKG